MSRILIALLFAASLAAPSFAQLPEDGKACSLIVVDVPHGSPAGKALVEMLNTTPELREIANRCQRHTFKPDSPLYLSRYASTFAGASLPIFAMCRPDGGVLYKASGANVPTDAKALTDELMHRIKLDSDLSRGDGIEWPSVAINESDCPGGKCPVPSYSPLSPLIPDSLITIQPSLFSGSSMTWYASGAVGLLLVGSLGLLFVVVLIVASVVIFRN